jgi:hypothetical protein
MIRNSNLENSAYQGGSGTYSSLSGRSLCHHQFRAARTGLLGLLAHGIQIVGGGNDRKEQNQQTDEYNRKLE